jgi:hypothetical protein
MVIVMNKCFYSYRCQSLKDDLVWGTLIANDIICLGERYTPVLWDGEIHPCFIKTDYIRKTSILNEGE